MAAGFGCLVRREEKIWELEEAPQYVLESYSGQVVSPQEEDSAVRRKVSYIWEIQQQVSYAIMQLGKVNHENYHNVRAQIS